MPLGSVLVTDSLKAGLSSGGTSEQKQKEIFKPRRWGQAAHSNTREAGFDPSRGWGSTQGCSCCSPPDPRCGLWSPQHPMLRDSGPERHQPNASLCRQPWGCAASLLLPALRGRTARGLGKAKTGPEAAEDKPELKDSVSSPGKGQAVT